MTTSITESPFQQPFYFPPSSVPVLGLLTLSDDEQRTVNLLQSRADLYYGQMLLTDSYYRGEQIITNLGIALPDEMAAFRSVVGWPRMAVDPIVDRLGHDGFRMPGQSDADEDLAAAWQANNMDSEHALMFTDALSMGRAYLTVGSSLEPGGLPVIRAESPLNVVVLWDVRTMRPKAALQSYWLEQSRHAALYLPDQTIHLAQDEGSTYGAWVVTDRDMHNFGRVPVVRIANNPRANLRDGASEITPEIMSITDQACRTMAQMGIAGEFYSIPQKIILGATEANFVKADGTAKKAFDTYITSVLALERDEDGNVPEIKQLQVYDPGVYIKVLENLASQMAGILGAPPQDLGLYTQGNPVSAESGQVAENRRNRRTRAKQSLFGSGLREGAQLALMFMNNGVLPDGAARMMVDWADPEQLAMSQASDAITKQIEAGSVPATSDVVLKRLGYSAIERERLAQDRDEDQGASFLQEIAHSLTATAATKDKRLDNDIVSPTTVPKPPPSESVPMPTPKTVFGGKPTA